MKIAVESFDAALAIEILPLAQQSWDECSEVKQATCAYHGQRGLAIDPNMQQYFMMAAQKALVAMTLRDDEGLLRGYSLAILYKSLHMQTVLCGNIDSFYVQPSARHAMPSFMTQVEVTLRNLGIGIIAWPVTRTGNLYKILQRRGYVADDVVMELKLEDLQQQQES